MQSVAAQTSGDMVCLFSFGVIFIDISVGKMRFQVSLSLSFFFFGYMHLGLFRFLGLHDQFMADK